MKDKLPNRWLLAGAGVLMQVALGAVYAWSVFRDPLIKAGGWSISEVTFTFSIAILILGFAAFLGGLWMSRVGPRVEVLRPAFAMAWELVLRVSRQAESGCFI